MTLVTEKRIRHLPVVENDRLAGVSPIGDVVKAIVSEQEFLIEQLDGDARLHLHRPVLCDVALTTDEP